MCRNCCTTCCQLNCVCQNLFDQLSHYPYFTCTIGINFNGIIDKNIILNNLNQHYITSADDTANRRQSQKKKENGEKDHMYHSLSIKRSFTVCENGEEKVKKTCLQLSNHHFRILVPGWKYGKDIIQHYIYLIKKSFPELVLTEMKIVSMNLSKKSLVKKNLDLYSVRNIIEENARSVRKDYRVFYNPKVGSDRAITIDFIGKQGKMRIFSTGSIMCMGICEPLYMKEQFEYFSQFLKE